jgi:hypothetical protein
VPVVPSGQATSTRPFTWRPASFTGAPPWWHASQALVSACTWKTWLEQVVAHETPSAARSRPVSGGSPWQTAQLLMAAAALDHLGGAWAAEGAPPDKVAPWQ